MACRWMTCWLLLAAAHGWGSDAELRMGLIWDRGAETVPALDTFSSVVDVAMSGEEIFVLDGTGHRVLVLDLNGEWLREFGRRGQGPGEFQGAHGDRVAILAADEQDDFHLRLARLEVVYTP